MEYGTPEEIVQKATWLEGRTLQEVLDLDVHPPEGDTHDYGNPRNKGGVGTLLEERFFGYKANSDRNPDFAEAGVELKATCLERDEGKMPSAGERLVLSMISYAEEMPDVIYDSHLWHKCRTLLLVWYQRDKHVPRYQQRIDYVLLWTPPAKDMVVIERDYERIAQAVRDGRAEDLSEGSTSYLAACTKGTNREKSMKDQSFYAPGKTARGRAWCYRRPYMTYVLRHYAMGEPEPDSIIKDPRVLRQQTVVEYATEVIEKNAGKTDVELCKELNIRYTGNKAQWSTIAYRLLGARGEQAAEFEKAGVTVRTVRPSERGTPRLDQNVPTNLDINFLQLVEETNWDQSELRKFLADTTFLFLVFQPSARGAVLRGCRTWHIPTYTLDTDVRACWEHAVTTVMSGVRLTKAYDRNGKLTIKNNLPKKSENSVAHVRPHSNQAAYLLSDGTRIGDFRRDAEMLPDGQWMTRQEWWLNLDYMYAQLRIDEMLGIDRSGGLG